MKVAINIDMNKKYYPIVTDDVVSVESLNIEILSKNHKISDEVLNKSKNFM